MTDERDATDAGAREVAEITALVRRQLASLSWPAGGSGDWAGFAADFVPGAPLYPAARPAVATTVPAFLARMQALCGTSLRSLDERLGSLDVRIEGNVAVAVAECHMTENGAATGRTLEVLLLVRSEGRWRIAAQAWDLAGPA